MTQALISRLSGLAETVEQIPVEFIQREKLASLASNAAQTLRDQLARIEALEAALKPFVLSEDRDNHSLPDHWQVTRNPEITMGDLRKARAALGDKA